MSPAENTVHTRDILRRSNVKRSMGPSTRPPAKNHDNSMDVSSEDGCIPPLSSHSFDLPEWDLLVASPGRCTPHTGYSCTPSVHMAPHLTANILAFPLIAKHLTMNAQRLRSVSSLHGHVSETDNTEA